MNSVRYTVLFEREDDGGYHAFVPSLKGCHSQGGTLDEAEENIRDAMALFLDSLRAAGEAAPREDLLIKPVEVAA